MPVKMLLIAAFTCLAAVAVGADDEKKPAAGKLGNVDKSKLFERMDADGDGKVTKDEYKKFRETAAEKIKDSGKGGNLAGKLDGLFDKLFEKMDADGDGKVTKDEFEKFQPAGNLDADKLQKLKDRLKKKDQE